MKELIFIDTGFVIGLIYEQDQYHQQAINLSIKYEQNSFVTTDAVLLELGNAVVRHSKPKAIKIIEDFYTSDNVNIVNLTPQLFQEAFNLYKQHDDKTWGLVDCLSFIVMWKLNINQVLTFDKHFSQAGFTILTE